MMRTTFTLGLIFSLSTLGCGSEPETTTAPGPAAKKAGPAQSTATPKTDGQPPADEPAPAVVEEIDYSVGQSTGAKTEKVEGEDSRNTLVDREIGVTVTAPSDRTWRLKLDSKGMFAIKDMSGNTMQIRVVPDQTDLSAALEHEIGYLQATLPEVQEKEKGADSVVLSVGANPAWAKKVPRTGWLKVKDVGGKIFACHGMGAESNYENSLKDYTEMCDSLAAPQ